MPRRTGQEAAIREDQQGQAVLHAAERAESTKKGMKAAAERKKRKTLADLRPDEDPGPTLMGAKVMFCGHNGWFVADLIRVGTAVAVRSAIAPLDGGTIIRGRNDEATHHVVDSPGPIAWWADHGILVVPATHVIILK
jgi:hypothetical protein